MGKQTGLKNKTHLSAAYSKPTKKLKIKGWKKFPTNGKDK